jgi:cytochrome b
MVGPRQARLGLLWRRVAGAGAWLRALASARSPGAVNWRQGGALATGLAILTMLALVLPLALSGYATYNDWGNALGGDALDELHEFFGNALLMVVALHLGLLTTLSLLRRQNLARPMLTGRMPGKGPDLVAKNRAWLAALLLVTAFAFGVWQWVDAPSGAPMATHTEHGERHD